MHSIRYGYAPESFNDVWNLNANRDHDYQLRNNNEFALPAPRIEFVKKQPIYTLPNEWNSLGNSRFQRNAVTFRIELKITYLTPRMRSKIKYNCMFILCLFVYLLRWGYQAVFQLLLQCSFACLCAGLCPSALFPPVPFCPSALHWVPRVVHATSYPQKNSCCPFTQCL